MSFTPGDAVQTPLGKGVVREVRNNGRLLIEVRGRAVVMAVDAVAALAAGRRPRGRDSTLVTPPPEYDTVQAGPRRAAREVDLHGLTVAEALVRAEEALNGAMLADLPVVRLIHGRTGGRIRAALHRRLREIPSVRAFRIDPRNDGVTIVTL